MMSAQRCCKVSAVAFTQQDVEYKGALPESRCIDEEFNATLLKSVVEVLVANMWTTMVEEELDDL